MATSTIKLGSSGDFFVTSASSLQLAFNDDLSLYEDNVGFFDFSLYENITGNLTLLKKDRVLGNYNNWQPFYDTLLPSKDYTYVATGLVNAGNNYNWSPEGWVGNLGKDVTENGQSAKTVSVSAGMANAPVAFGGGSITNPTNATTVRITSNGIDNGFVVNGLPIPVTNSNGQYGQMDFTLSIIGKPTTSYSFRNTNGGWGGGTVRFTFNSYSNFLAPELDAYSLVGKINGLGTKCLGIVNISVTPSGAITGSGYIPPSGNPILPENPNISGNLLIDIKNNGSVCSGDVGEIYNKITEFHIESFYPEEQKLYVDYDLKEPYSSNSTYLAYTEDKNYTVYYSGFVTTGYIYPVTNITGYFLSGLVGLTGYNVTGDNGQIQICYKEAITGSGIGGTGILERLFGQEITGVTGSGSGFIEYNYYEYQLATGVLSKQISGFDPQMFNYYNNVDYNDDWLNSNYSTVIKNLTTGNNIYLDPLQSANIFNISSESGFYTEITKSYKYTNPDIYARKNAFTIKMLNDDFYTYNNYNSNLAAWASYNVSSGATSKNVISYALEIVNDLFLSGQEILDTGNRNYPPSILFSGTDVRSEYLTYCIANNLLDCDEKELKDLGICFTGDVNSTAYISFVSGVKKKFSSSPLTEYDGPQSQDFISSGSIESYFKYNTGELTFNTFKSGDSFLFDLYPFDYTGLYNSHFSANPIYNTTGLRLTYPTDFQNITGLVSKINQRLSGVSYPVWYPYDCLSGSGNSPIYIDGGLLSAKVKDLSTGDFNYNNIIQLISLRNNTGYNIRLDLTPRNNVLPKTNNNKLKYLLPSYIRLEGSNNSSGWTTLDVRTGIDWTKLEPIEREITGSYSGINKDFILEEIAKPEKTSSSVIDSSGEFITLYSFIQSGQIVSKASCPPQPFVREIEIIKPTGFAPDAEFDPITCNVKEKEPDGDEDKDKDGEDDINNDPTQTYLLKYLRTGWLLDESFVGQPLTGINYNYYRVYISGFESSNYEYENLSNNFIIKNINLFSSSVIDTPVHTGQDLCAIGANYSVNVQGSVPVILTGNLTGLITESQKGVYSLNNQKVLMKISGQQSGSNIKFNNVSGKLISNSGTGFITDKITGYGCFNTGITDWFYDPITYTISFQKNFSSCFSGSGNITGEYIRLKPAFVNEQLAYGGFFNETFSVSITTGVQFTGLAIAQVVAQNLTGLYNYTGTITGYANSGYYQLISGINLLLNYPTESDNVAAGITGYKNSSAWLNYNSPMEFDWISINDKTISYSSDSGVYSSPDFYSNSGNLLDIINGNPTVFLSSGSVQMGKIYLESLISGSEGNEIALSFGKGENIGLNYPTFQTSNLTGGVDLYNKIYATGNYTGKLDIVLLSSGFYTSNNAVGNISGPIDVYQGTRDFTGVWGLTTGNFYTGYVNFAENNLFNYDTYSNTIGDSNFGISPKTIDVLLLYNNILNTNSTDVVKFTISGLNTNSGIVRYISGDNS